MEEKVGLSSPWTEFYREVKELFGLDPEIRIAYDESNYVISLYVSNGDKAEALTKLLPDTVEFGNVSVKICVIPPNLGDIGVTDILKKAFDKNPVLSYIRSVKLFETDVNYVVFKNKVVQYFNDDLSDVNGLKSTLYETIAADVFKDLPGVYFCTDIPIGMDEEGKESSESLGKPLSEWP